MLIDPDILRQFRALDRRLNNRNDDLNNRNDDLNNRNNEWIDIARLGCLVAVPLPEDVVESIAALYWWGYFGEGRGDIKPVTLPGAAMQMLRGWDVP